MLKKVNTFDNEEYFDNIRQQTTVDQNTVLLVLRNNSQNPSGLLIHIFPSQEFKIDPP